MKVCLVKEQLIAAE